MASQKQGGFKLLRSAVVLEPALTDSGAVTDPATIALLTWDAQATKEKCGTSFQTCRIAQSVSLLQLALSRFGKIEVFLDHLGRVLREFLYVGIGSRIGLFLKFGQILFVVFHHHIHVRFI